MTWAVTVHLETEQEANELHDFVAKFANGMTALSVFEVCGQDYMAGQVCSKAMDHDGGHD